MKRFRTSGGLHRCGGLLIALGVSLVPLSACQICFPVPRQSAADALLGAEVIVLARENPDRPFSLTPAEILRGDRPLDDLAIDLFLDSVTRRILAAYPDRAVVCAYDTTTVPPTWSRVGLANAAIEPVFREILQHAESWEQQPAERSAYFGTLLGHEDPQLRTLAHLEVARSPYGEIRRIGRTVPREHIHTFLRDHRFAEWHALYILLLAQSGHPDDRAYIIQSLRDAARFSLTSQLAAWTTAFLEIDPEQALSFLDEHYLGSPDREPQELRAIAAALSVHGTSGDSNLRNRIMEDYKTLLVRDPALAPLLTTDARRWNRWDLADDIAAILAAPPDSLDRGTLFGLRAYVKDARSQGQQLGDGPDRAKTIPLLVVGLAGLMLLPLLLLVNRVKRRSAIASPSPRPAPTSP